MLLPKGKTVGHMYTVLRFDSFISWSHAKLPSFEVHLDIANFN